MAVNTYYDKHSSQVHDKYREQESHLKRLNQIQMDLHVNKMSSFVSPKASTFINSPSR